MTLCKTECLHPFQAKYDSRQCFMYATCLAMLHGVSKRALSHYTMQTSLAHGSMYEVGVAYTRLELPMHFQTSALTP